MREVRYRKRRLSSLNLRIYGSVYGNVLPSHPNGVDQYALDMGALRNGLQTHRISYSDAPS